MNDHDERVEAAQLRREHLNWTTIVVFIGLAGVVLQLGDAWGVW